MALNIDLTNIKSEAVKTNNLNAIVLSPSGGGKSYLIGSLKGRVLYIYGGDESHGKISAAGQNAEIFALDWSRNPNTGENLNADESYELILALMTNEFLDHHGITAIALDSLTSLEKLVRSTAKWAAGCKTKDGAHNSFAEGEVSQRLIDAILNRVRDLQVKRELDLVTTCIVDVKDMDETTGEYLTVKPRLSTFGVAEGTIQQFPQVLLVGPVRLKDPKTKKEKLGRCLQFNANVSRVSSDSNGVVKKYLNFNPRIIGANRDLKNFEKADLESVRELLK